jgi:CheY-like chemotaxis protein
VGASHVGPAARRDVLVHHELGRGGEDVTVEERAPRVLAADDDPDVIAALKLLLRGEGFELETAGSPDVALAALESRDSDVALLDLNYARDTTSGREGLELVERLRALDPPPSTSPPSPLPARPSTARTFWVLCQP